MLHLDNVVRVSVLTELRTLPDINSSNLALIVDEAPIPADYGVYRSYLEPNSIEKDFGSASDALRLANMVFSQVPNIKTGKGKLFVIPRDPAALAQPAVILSEFFVDFSKFTADDYAIRAAVDGGAAGDIAIGAVDATSLATISASLNVAAITAEDLVFTVQGEPSKCRVTLSTTTIGAASAIALSTTTIGAGTDISPLLFMEAETSVGTVAGLESIKDCILRTYKLVPFFGLIYNVKMTNPILLSVAKVCQAYKILQFVGSSLTADITVTTGIFDIIKEAGLKNTRCQYYSESEDDAIDYAAGYASRALCVNFSAPNSMHTMNLKEITGIVPDPIFSEAVGQTRYDQCKAAGADCYANYGVPGISCSGANGYFDAVYIGLSYGMRVQVAAFNFLKATNTKIPQTDAGMAGLVSACARVAGQYVTNGSFAPGTWDSPVIFGDPETHIRNIAERGFHFYHQPVGEQPAVDRRARLAMPIQNANKMSGAIHGADILLYLE